MVVVLLLAILAVFGVTATVSYLSTDVYQDEDEFEKYVDEEVKKLDSFAIEGNTKVVYEYDSPVSFAVVYGECDDESIASFRDARIDEFKSLYRQEAEKKEAERAEKAEDKDKYRPLERALVLEAGVYESSEGVMSLAIMETSNVEKDKEMAMDDSVVHTYQFSAKTGKRMVPHQIFEDGYRATCSQYFSEYFRAEYEKEELKDGWENYVAAIDSNYNKFTISEKGVTFFFDEDTVLKKSAGVIAVGVGMSNIGECLREKPIERYIDPSKPMVAITYDDGPGGKAESRILDCLEKNGEVATFFYLGNRVSGDTENVKRAYDMGCEIGSHTWNHPNLSKLKKNEVAKQFKDTNAAVRAVIGTDPSVFRPSYGITSDAINRASGVPVIMWNVDTLDWKSRDAKKVFNAVKKVKDLDGNIILMHSIYDSTAEATELIVPWLQKNGYQTVTVSELIKYKTGEEPQAGHVYGGF